MPEISVIVPVYRAESFLRKCTESILSQTFSDLELLLVDDGSPDSCGTLCDQWATRDGRGALCDAIAREDSRVRVFHKENGGVSSARNLGLEEARGRYIAFADAVYPHHILKTAVFLRRSEHCGDVFIFQLCESDLECFVAGRFYKSGFDGFAVDGFRFFIRKRT